MFRILHQKKYIFITVMIILILELFICNFRSWESLFFTPINFYKIELGDGLIDMGNNNFYVDASKNCFIELTNINQKVHNIYLNISSTNEEEPYLYMDLYAKDEGHNAGYLFTSVYIYDQVPRSHYIKCNLFGKAKSIAMDFSNYDKQTIQLTGVSLNSRVPFHLSLARVSIMLFLSVLIYCLISINKWKDYTFEKLDQKHSDTKHPNNKSLYYFILILFFILTVQLGLWITYMRNNDFYSRYDAMTMHYARLAESLAEGHFDINLDVDQNLKKLSNPYDSTLRLRENALYHWDYAYYNGKYYVYFGIVPVLLTYLPFYLITGTHILTYWVVILGLVLTCIGLLVFMWHICKYYFPKTPVVLFLLLYLLGINAIGGSYLSHAPDFYSVPIIFSISFVLWGISGILKATQAKGKTKYFLLIISAFFMALVAGCRPQFLVASFLLIPLLWNEVFANGKLKKSGYKIILCIIIPYLIVAIGIMYYNYARFQSVFDFGAKYNLTYDDMTHRGFDIDRIFPSIYTYLLQPLVLKASFPFVGYTDFTPVYHGEITNEATYGGSIFWCPILFLTIYYLFNKKYQINSKVKICAVLCLIFTLLIIIVDGQMAGINYRYTLDYMGFLIVPAFVVIFDVFSRKVISITHYKLLSLLVIYSLLLYEFGLPFVNDMFTLTELDITFWGNLHDIFQII